IGDLYGSDRVALATVEALVDAGLPVTVALGEWGPPADHLRPAGAAALLVPTPSGRRAALPPAGLPRRLVGAVRGDVAGVRLRPRSRPAIVYVATITIPLWLLLARSTGRATICHVHEAERDVSGFVHRALHAPLRLAHLVIANSAFTAGVTAVGVP